MNGCKCGKMFFKRVLPYGNASVIYLVRPDGAMMAAGRQAIKCGKQKRWKKPIFRRTLHGKSPNNYQRPTLVSVLLKDTLFNLLTRRSVDYQRFPHAIHDAYKAWNISRSSITFAHLLQA